MITSSCATRPPAASRPMDKYLDQIGEIRRLQECIVERAERHRVPVIESTSLEGATSALLDLVLSRAPSRSPQRLS